jgi:tripartite-type tricarboxylate transporter receptor subunit TctC
MISTRRNRSHSCFLAAATVAVLTIGVPARPVAAQPAYPERGLVLIVPYPAGGGTDVTARLLAREPGDRARQARHR